MDHIFNSRKISHMDHIFNLRTARMSKRRGVSMALMPSDDVDQMHSFLNKDNLPPVSCLASYNSNIDTICFHSTLSMVK